MIVRVLTAKVRAARVGQFNKAMRELQEEMRRQSGLVYVKLARRLQADGGEEVVLFEEWRDPDSVYAWAGPDLSVARLTPSAHGAAEEISVMHYEALDMDTLAPPDVSEGIQAGPKHATNPAGDVGRDRPTR